MNIAILHPDLGLGGAERLVVDAAIELEARGHRVVLYTAGHDRGHAFPETVDGRIEVRLRGAFLPTRIAGRLQAACAVLRTGWAGARLAAEERFDVVLCDVVPYAIPLLRALGRSRIVYYCHYPDQLLAPARVGWRRLYRAPLDRLEVPAMRAADRVVVNSRFTAAALARLGGLDAEVVYPGVDVAAYAGVPDAPEGEALFLVVGRFDRRKNLALAVLALAHLRAHRPSVYRGVRVVIAGGFDPERSEDATVLRDLEALALAHEVGERLTFELSPSDERRLELLAAARAVVHTTEGEHFGLVPVEAMASARPVVAVAAAGLLETIVDGETGFLCAPTAEDFALAMARLAEDRELSLRMGRAGRVRAERFSRSAFGAALERLLLDLVARGPH